MSFLVSVDILPRFFLIFQGTGGKCRVHSSGSVVMCSAQMSAVGSVMSLLDSGMLSGPLISVRLGAVVEISCVGVHGFGGWWSE